MEYLWIPFGDLLMISWGLFEDHLTIEFTSLVYVAPQYGFGTQNSHIAGGACM